MAMMLVSVHSALRIVGALKMGTPLLTASTPVMAVQPLENARMSSQKLTVVVGAANAGRGVTGTG